VTNLVVSEAHGTITATWNASRIPTLRTPHVSSHGFFDLSYQCTLMYGFNLPSTYTVVTTSTTCSFGGLDPTAVFGIEVAVSYGGPYSLPVIGFPAVVTTSTTTTTTTTTVPAVPPTPKTIKCVRGTVVRHVRGINPHCPAGFTHKR
jgi:hypothetical protein